MDRPAALIFDHASRNRRVYRALCGKQGGTIVSRYLHDMIVELLLVHLRQRPLDDAHRNNPPDEVVAEFYASSTLGLLTWWIDTDFERDPARLADDYRQLAGLGTGPLPAPDNHQLARNESD